MNKKTLDPETSPQAKYGIQLRRSREAKGYTQAKLAEDTPCDASYISKLETGAVPPTKDMSERFDEVLETGGTLLLMYRQWKDAALKEGFPEYVKLEAKADLVRLFDVWTIHGLLQTKEYATALVDAAVKRGRITRIQADEIVAVRLSRQGLLDRTPAPTLHVVLDEGCLRHVVGGPSVMARQLWYLEQLARRPNIVIQVAPFSMGERIPFTSAIHLLALRDRTVLAYAETMQRGYLDRDRDTATAWSRDYDRLQIEALAQADSLALIRAVRRELVNMTDAIGLQGTSWLKSTYSDVQGSCVEVAPGFPGVVPVRDSKDPDGPALTFSADAWASFVAAVSDGELPTV